MLDPNTWEELTENRTAWRTALHSGIEASERAFLSKLEDKQRKRKMAASCNSDFIVFLLIICRRQKWPYV
jgi:hypothetical protein